jgi:hypothetical protein
MQTAQKYPLEPETKALPVKPTGERKQGELPLREIIATIMGLFFILSIIQYNLSHVPYSETEKLYTNLGFAVIRTLDPNR